MAKIDAKKLWMQVCNGDQRAFEMFYKANAKRLYQYGLSFTPKNELIEDVIQNLFLYLFQNHLRHKNDINIQSYLIKSFRNNLLRAITNEKRYFYPENDTYIFDVAFSIEHRIMATDEDLLRKKQLKVGITRLTSKQKEIIYFLVNG